MYAISIIICAHNPRADAMKQTLAGLMNQRLPVEEWELLLIDNASASALAEDWDLSWHPHARHVRESQLGLSHARIRGISESNGQVLVFVDDDNVLEPDYLLKVKELAAGYPFLGAFGGSSLLPKEHIAPDYAVSLLPRLAVRQIKEPFWHGGSLQGIIDYLPFGAGLVVRREVAEIYTEHCVKEPKRKELDRTGKLLSSCGDTDLALCSLLLNKGVGFFPELQLTHLIPVKRFDQEYLIRLSEGIAYSGTWLRYFWNLPVEEERGKSNLPGFLFNVTRDVYKILINDQTFHFRKKVIAAEKRGRARALEEIRLLD